ncbi:hypothetical protein GJAV_G00126550 [Gymnothorax javanicus]|nr:hypothetical protein GJAV_G00126550 [Gymnothorax javanicus]
MRSKTQIQEMLDAEVGSTFGCSKFGGKSQLPTPYMLITSDYMRIGLIITYISHFLANDAIMWSHLELPVLQAGGTMI